MQGSKLHHFCTISSPILAVFKKHPLIIKDLHTKLHHPLHRQCTKRRGRAICTTLQYSCFTRAMVGRLRKAVEGCGRLWKAAEGYGRLWKAAEGCGRLRKPAEGCGSKCYAPPICVPVEFKGLAGSPPLPFFVDSGFFVAIPLHRTCTCPVQLRDFSLTRT